MPARSFQLLQTVAERAAAPALWLLDEQAPALKTGLEFVTHRYDIYRNLQDLGANIAFHDFDFNATLNNHYRTVLYRISKEKPLVHHLINSAWKLLQKNGELWLCGAKNEGIKTYLTKAAKLFGGMAPISHHSGLVLGRLIKKNPSVEPALLDSQDYARLRAIGEHGNSQLLSKPGLFGWNKIDAGSALLAEQLAAVLAQTPATPKSLLDLGCGYGYLALQAAQLHSFQRIVGSDNNAAALLACRANFTAHNIMGEVIADDCGAMLSEKFDLILCNPPFHRGFEHDKALTDSFIATAAQRLNSSGQAIFVVNRFIPLERLAAPVFEQINTVAENRSFRVIRLARARI